MKNRRERGNSIIEFSLMTPWLILLFIGAMDWGFYAYALICTEKDVFNLNGALKLRLPLYACQIRMVLKQEEAFWGAVMEAITRNRPAARE